MSKKFSFFLVSILAVMIVLLGCGNSEETDIESTDAEKKEDVSTSREIKHVMGTTTI